MAEAWHGSPPCAPVRSPDPDVSGAEADVCGFSEKRTDGTALVQLVCPAQRNSDQPRIEGFARQTDQLSTVAKATQPA